MIKKAIDIEKFIGEHYADNYDYNNTSASACSLSPFVFPQGHKLRIRNFVSEVRRKLLTATVHVSGT